jgi:hybrid polyketide synthase/nonribosomal peptide synthetase ACE1
MLDTWYVVVLGLVFFPHGLILASPDIKDHYMVVHEATALLADALHQQVRNHLIRLVFTISIKDRVQPEWLYVPQNVPQRLLKKALPTSSTVFVDLSYASGSVAVEQLIQKCLLKSCAVCTSDSLYGTTANGHPESSPSGVVATFKTAWDAVFKSKYQFYNPVILDLSHLHEVPVMDTPLAVVVCEAAQILVNIKQLTQVSYFKAARPTSW